MKQEELRLYSINEVIAAAMSRMNTQKNSGVSGDVEFSINIVSEENYKKIWNSFIKWCIEQTDQGNLLNIFSFANMFYMSQQNEGIIIKLTDFFLREHGLKWYEPKSIYESLYRMKYENNQPQISKINFIDISTEVNMKKILVQNSLNTIFNTIGTLLGGSLNCQVDLGVLGNLKSFNKTVYHIPTKLKNDKISNKKATIRGLLSRGEKTEEEQKTASNNVTENENPELKDLTKSIENQIDIQNSEDKAKQLLEPNQNDGLTEQQRLEIKNAKDLIKQTLKGEGKGKYYEEEKNRLPPVKTKRIIQIPMKDEYFDLKSMVRCDFSLKKIQKAKANPVLFNLYSNTKAAPFTAEKTQIPIAHRIGSFYSLSLQNFIVDKTSKNIKRLNDDYFTRSYNEDGAEKPATEQEEYQYILGDTTIPIEKIELKNNSFQRYLNFIEKSVPEEYIAVMKQDWIVQIIKMINRFYLMKQYDILVNDSFKEITSTYKTAMKTSILDYILKHPEQREKLNIPISFRRLKEYADEQVKRPSDGNFDWKNSWNRNKLAISNNLYIMCENATKIMKYFTKNLQGTSYIVLKDVTGDRWPTVKLAKFSEAQKNQIDEEKTLVNDTWRKFVENVLKENKIYKDQLILYFKSISGLMSSELRKLIIGSIEQYYNFILQFKQERYLTPKEIFDNQFDPKQPFQKSFIEVELIEHPSMTKFSFSDELEDIHKKLTELIKEIINKSKDVERPDNMFIKSVEKHENLWEVPFEDSVVKKMYNEIDQIINENLNNIDHVTDLYDDFKFVLKVKEDMDAFLASKPKREVFEKQIKTYEEKLEVLNTMPNYLYMNMIRINCTELNNTIRTKIENAIYECLKSILSDNILNKSKTLVEGCENILNKLKTQVSNEEILFNLENAAEQCRTETIPQLLNDYEDFLEWVFFYLKYDTYKVFESGKENSNMFEQSIKGCHDNFIQIEMAMKSFNDVLENQKKKFTADLDQERAKLLEDIGKLKREIDDDKENIRNKIYGDKYEPFLKEILDKNENAKNYQERLKKVVEKEIYLGNPFTTEDERVDQILNDLDPMIKYFSFVNSFKEVHKKDGNEFLYQINLNEMKQFYEEKDIFDRTSQKLTNYRNQIEREKAKFKTFRDAFEFAELIKPIMAIYEEEGIEDKEIYMDNKYYCEELIKFFPTSFTHEIEDVQEALKEIRFYDMETMSEKLFKHRQGIEKVVSEWEKINNMYDDEHNIGQIIDTIEFTTVKYNEKEYYIIANENFETVIETLDSNIRKAQTSLDDVEKPKEEILVINVMEKMLEDMKEILKVVKNLEKVQGDLIKLMDKTVEIKKKPEIFLMLKQAEKQYKGMMDLIAARKFKVKGIHFDNEKFSADIEELTKLLTDINKNLNEMI